MTTSWSPAELLFLLGVAVMIALLIAGEVLEPARVRRTVRTQGQGSGDEARLRDERVLPGGA